MKLSKLFDSVYNFRDVQDMADKFNKYGLAAKHIGGKFYSYRNGKETGGPFDTVDQLSKHQEELIANESAEATIKPYISMYKGDDGKQVYDVLDKHSKSAFKTNDYDKAKEYFKNNFDKLKEAGGYEGQSEPTSHTFKDADIRKIADIIKQKNIKAYPEQTDDGVKVHTFNQDRESVAKELEIEESVDPLRSDQGAKEELAKEIYNNNEEYQTEYEDWEAFMNSDDFEEENMRLKSKFEQQPEQELTADEHDEEDIDQLPAFLKKAKSKEQDLNRMRKLAGMSTASTNEDYAKMTHGLITKLVNQGKTDDEIQQATGETSARIEIIRKSTEEEKKKQQQDSRHNQESVTEYDGPDETQDDGKFSDKQIKMAFGVLNDPRFKQGNYDGAVSTINKIAPGLADHPSVSKALMRANEATNDLVKNITPMKNLVGTNASPQMTAKGIDAISQGERPSPQQVKAVEPYMSKIAQAMQDPKTKTQMRNIIKKVQ